MSTTTPDPFGAREEFRALIASLINPDATPEANADAIVAATFGIDDDWDELQVGTMARPDQVMLQRYLRVRFPREAKHEDRTPDRTVATEAP